MIKHCLQTTMPGPFRLASVAPLLALLFSGLAGTSTAWAQFRPLVIQNAKILVGDGRVIENASIAVQGDRIAAVGPDVSASFLARKVDARNKYVTPGLIDVHSTLGLPAATGGGQAVAKAIDAFDRYAENDIRAALQNGITTVYLPARGQGGFAGRGAVIRLKPRADLAEMVLDEEAALCAAVGTRLNAGPIVRVQTVEELRRRFIAAREYREAWDDYQEDLEEYEKKLAEQAQAEEKKSGENEGENKSKAGAGEEDKKKPAKKNAGQNEKQEEELKKPEEPAKDRNTELLLRVLDGELRLRVEAHAPGDILNVLELAEEFHAALVLEGATAAYLVAERLAASAVPVVVSGPSERMAYEPGWRRYARPDAAALLERAGVKVYVASGFVPAETAPHLALAAARAVGHGWDAEAALRAITGDAAKLLGVDEDVGLVAGGHYADLVIWTDHPLSANARVERVFVGGREVFHAEREDGKP